jgi:hypothetical protein
MNRLITGGLSLALLVAASTAALAQDTAPVRSAADLPAVRFPTAEPPSRVYMTEAFLRDVLLPASAEVERLLASRPVEDPAILNLLRTGLANIALIEGRGTDALGWVRAQRADETKVQLSQAGGLVREAVAAGLLVPEADRCAAAARQMTATLAAADPKVVRDEVILRWGQVQVASPAFHAGTAALMFDDTAREQGSLGLLEAVMIANLRYESTFIPPCRAELSAALRGLIDNPESLAEDVWAERDLPPNEVQGDPVAVAVWEAGFDTTLFGGRMAADPAEPLDGLDNDGNGIVDDVWGPTFGADLEPSDAPLRIPSPTLASRLGLQMALEKGLQDLRYGFDTPEGRLAAVRSQQASIEEQTLDVAASAEWSGWVHGTWVAGLIADGAPWTRLSLLNLYPFGDQPQPLRFEEADAEQFARRLQDAAPRLRGSGVRVVNMSWGLNSDAVAQLLLITGAETDEERARVRGRALAATMRSAFEQLLVDCPDILFVAAAGNTDQTTDIAETIPQTLDSPNLLVVGAAGRSGQPTAFTSYGAGVRLYALGEAVQVRAPGGQIMTASGTSFASPLTARAAAAMLSANPALTPAQVIEGLIATARPAEGADLPLLDSRAALRWAEARP